MKNLKVYVAAPLFSQADREFNEKITKELEKINGITCYLPQRNPDINDKTKSAKSTQIYAGDTEKLKECDVLVALLDGTVVDPGVAAEIGWVAGWNESGKPEKFIIGLFTDSRDGTNTPAANISKKVEILNNEVAESQFPYINLYVIGAVKEYGHILKNVEDAITMLTSLAISLKNEDNE